MSSTTKLKKKNQSNCIEVRSAQDNMPSFEMYTLVSVNIRTYLRTHHYNYDNEYVCQPQVFPVPFVISLVHPYLSESHVFTGK
jgi:hypothetical protein